MSSGAVRGPIFNMDTRRIPVVAFVGRSGCGKTTLIEALIPPLRAAGWRLTLIKHTHHRDVVTDVPGSDTARYRQAGAEQVLLVTPNAVIHTTLSSEEIPLATLLTRLQETDLVLVEGYKGVAWLPKIEVLRAAHHPHPLPDLTNRIAYVTDVAGLRDAPCFGFDELPALRDFITAFARQMMDNTGE